MKTDNYLTLCLEQAAKSPLHYRHGCIIVRGGKVIGQGHNDYRPGFDGGALKHGRVANSALSGTAIADLKAKLKERKDAKAEGQQLPPKQLAAFEKVGLGGGPQANTPLSMHSEMMAIHSALSTSSTLACSTVSHQKPCFKLPRGDKKKERLRRDVLQNYVERICEPSTSTTDGSRGKIQVQECGFVRASSQRRGGTGSPKQPQRPPRGSGSAAAARGGQGVSGSEEYGETPQSVREERSTQRSRVPVSRVPQEPFGETDTARFFAATTTTAICV